MSAELPPPDGPETAQLRRAGALVVAASRARAAGDVGLELGLVRRIIDEVPEVVAVAVAVRIVAHLGAIVAGEQDPAEFLGDLLVGLDGVWHPQDVEP